MQSQKIAEYFIGMNNHITLKHMSDDCLFMIETLLAILYSVGRLNDFVQKWVLTRHDV